VSSRWVHGASSPVAATTFGNTAIFCRRQRCRQARVVSRRFQERVLRSRACPVMLDARLQHEPPPPQSARLRKNTCRGRIDECRARRHRSGRPTQSPTCSARQGVHVDPDESFARPVLNPPGGNCRRISKALRASEVCRRRGVLEAAAPENAEAKMAMLDRADTIIACGARRCRIMLPPRNCKVARNFRLANRSQRPSARRNRSIERFGQIPKRMRENR